MSLLPEPHISKPCNNIGFTRSGLEPIIYRTRGEHVNHYITFAVEIDMGIEIKNNICNKRKTIYTKEV
jgi:hypothetical protein